ncbi:restriction endonuclease subunit S [Salmonella enterica]|nr:restriction endonuclease subunit S [Salmonella enterica]
MSSKFRKVKLCEILSFKTGKLDSNAAVDNGCYPFFTCSPVTLSINTHAFDTEAVLLAGNNANGVFSVKYHNGKFNAYQRTYVITPLDNSAVNVKWLYFRIKYVTSELQSMSVGTATKFLTKKILDSFEIELPTFEEQTYQAQILWALQDKLANHEAINQTLEQMAQALFKSWFVDFEPVKAKMAALEAGGSQEDATRAAMTAISGKDADALVVFAREHPEQYAELKTTAELFPSAMQDSEQGEIPEGWSLGNIKNSIDIINGYAFKSPDYTSEGVFVLRTKNFHSNHYVERLDDDVFLPRSFLKEYSKYNCEPYDYHMVMVGASIGHSAIIYPHSLPALRNQNMWCFRPKKTSFVGKAYTKTILDKIIGELKGFASGSAREFFRKGDFENKEIVLANKELHDFFEILCFPYIEMQGALCAQSEHLSQLRDTLLPKLLSGEITLPEAEQIISEEA